MRAQHPSPAGASPWRGTEETTSQSSDTLKKWGYTGAWAIGRGAPKSQGAQHPSKAKRTLTDLSFLPLPVGVSGWEANHNPHIGSGLQDCMYSLSSTSVWVRMLPSSRPGSWLREQATGKSFWEAGP